MNYLAQVTNPAFEGSGLQNLEGAGYFDKLLSTGITIIFIVGGVTFLFMLLLGGIQWITAGGDSKATEAASGRIRTAIIGLVLLFSAYAIVSLIQNIFGVKILTIDIAPLVIQ